VNLELFSSKRGGTVPNLVGIQAPDLDMLPTVLVCPILAGLPVSGVRTTVVVEGRQYTVLCELARPINRRVLCKVGELDESSSRRVMRVFHLMLAQ
jgi:hypothetical protein